eukprot:TRINITY_DN1656_c0_g3_i1.p1 TRINITY_DN1656_c0_g3~~TRINITY_DN1656_c0_g3_i1.p1  ORF type:complete len:204 (+),score=39.25 TRINITY_DN1656_c0_g3_i1:12-623(+)
MKRMIKIVILAIMFIYLSNSQGHERVDVHLFVMSKCPYAAYFVGLFQQHVMSAQGLSDITNITFDYIAKEDPSQPTGFFSKHGQNEVKGDFIELCVESISKDIFPFVVCMDKQYSDIPQPAQDCASQINLDYTKIEQCVSERGTQLLKESIKRTGNIADSPTVYIGNECVYGPSPCNNLDPDSDLIKKFICSKYNGPLPPGCQ